MTRERGVVMSLASNVAETRALDAHDDPRAQGLFVEVLSGPERGRIQEAPCNRPFVVGTHPEASLVLTDDTVSRMHLELVSLGPRILARDLGSTNGCVHEGAQFTELEVPLGAVIRIGETELRLRAEADAVSLPPSEAECFGALRGRSLRMRQVFALLERASRSDVTVLVTGETGTGKEVVAQSLHSASPRAHRPLVVVDCSAMPAQLIESELFGHVQGAFTGAVSDRLGAFREADGGTVFLDELGELPVELQPRLLRVLETRTVKPIGSNEAIPVDVRVVAATNRNLEDMVRSRRFRSDLFFRLAVIRVPLPALRDRREDIPLLARFFADKYAPEERPLRIRPQTMAALISNPWPGNVRELRNVIEQAATLSSRNLSLVADLARNQAGEPEIPLGFEPYFDLPFKEARQNASYAFEKAYAERRIYDCGGNLTQAAREMGLHRNMVRRILNRRPSSDLGA